MTSNNCNVIPIEFIFRFFTTHLISSKINSTKSFRDQPAIYQNNSERRGGGGDSRLSQ